MLFHRTVYVRVETIPGGGVIPCVCVNNIANEKFSFSRNAEMENIGGRGKLVFDCRSHLDAQRMLFTRARMIFDRSAAGQGGGRKGEGYDHCPGESSSGSSLASERGSKRNANAEFYYYSAANPDITR